MERLVDEYLVFLHDTKQVSENTYASYKRDLKKLVQYLNEESIPDITKVDTPVMQNYINYLEDNDYAASTITRSFIAIKSFFRFLCNKGYMDANPSNQIKLPKAASKPNAVLSREEMKRLVNKPVVFSFKGLRDRAMLLLLYDTKISISELVRLKVGSIDFEHSILVFSKEGQKCEYQLNDSTKEALDIYVRYREMGDGDWLFPNRYGNPMSRQGFWKTIKNYAKEVGIEKEITLFSIKQGEI